MTLVALPEHIRNIVHTGDVVRGDRKVATRGQGEAAQTLGFATVSLNERSSLANHQWSVYFFLNKPFWEALNVKNTVDKTKLFGFRHLATAQAQKPVAPALQAKLGGKAPTRTPVGYHAVTSKIGITKG